MKDLRLNADVGPERLSRPGNSPLEPSAETATEDSWRAEVRRRVEDLRSGAVPSIPGEQVFQEIDSLL